MEFLKRKPDDGRSLVKEGWTFYDSYGKKGKAEYYAKILERSGKHVTVDEVEYDGRTTYKVWYKE
jgi:hypothetical protein